MTGLGYAEAARHGLRDGQLKVTINSTGIGAVAAANGIAVEDEIDTANGNGTLLEQDATRQAYRTGIDKVNALLHASVGGQRDGRYGRRGVVEAEGSILRGGRDGILRTITIGQAVEEEDTIGFGGHGLDCLPVGSQCHRNASHAAVIGLAHRAAYLAIGCTPALSRSRMVGTLPLAFVACYDSIFVVLTGCGCDIKIAIIQSAIQRIGCVGAPLGDAHQHILVHRSG